MVVLLLFLLIVRNIETFVLNDVKSFTLSKLSMLSNHNIDDNNNNIKPLSDQERLSNNLNNHNYNKVIGLTLSTLYSLIPNKVDASISSRTRDSLELQRGLVNIGSDDFWYPPYMIGEWNAKMKFIGANFSSNIPLQDLSLNNRVPGFNRYSVIFAPDMGEDINCILRYVELDSHTREDHPHNIRNLIKCFLPDTKVIDAKYSFQKQSNWISSPANKWLINYEDENGYGKINLFTRKRLIDISAGVVETTEFFQQTHERIENNKKSIIQGEYALNWKLRTSASGRDQFVTVDQLRKSTDLEGSLDIYVYLSPTDELYDKEPKKPVGVFSYDISLERIKGNSKNTIYPFVPNDVGPIELNEYFGY